MGHDRLLLRTTVKHEVQDTYQQPDAGNSQCNPNFLRRSATRLEVKYEDQNRQRNVGNHTKYGDDPMTEHIEVFASNEGDDGQGANQPVQEERPEVGGISDC